MARSPAHFLSELLSPWGDIELKRMFGSLGAWRNGVFFALIADDVVYFKVNDTTREAYRLRGADPFSYLSRKLGRSEVKVIDTLWRVPDEVLENQEELIIWTDLAWQIGLEKSRSPKSKPIKNLIKAKQFNGLSDEAIRLLLQQGITSLPELEHVGAIEAFKQIDRAHPASLTRQDLYALYAIANHLHVSEITQDLADHITMLLKAETHVD